MDSTRRTPVQRVITATTVAFGALAALMGGIADPAYAQSKYKFIRLGAPANTSGFYTGGRGINDAGHVVGVTGPWGGNWYHAFYWADSNRDSVFQSSEMMVLGTLGGSHSIAYAINRADQVVGRAYLAPAPNGTQDVHAFVWQPGQAAVTDLNTLIDASSVSAGVSWVLTDAVDINDGGVILAHGRRSVTNPDGTVTTQQQQPCLLRPGGSGLYTLTDLNVSPVNPGAPVKAAGLSSSGNQAVLQDNNLNSYYWDGAVSSLLSIPTVQSVNSSGVIVGQADFGGQRNACLLSSPTAAPQNLGTLSSAGGSSAWDINDTGTVVGRSVIKYQWQTGATYHGFRWQAGTGMVNLNNLVTWPKGNKVFISEAYSLSPGGLITGNSYDGSNTYAFVMIPLQ